MLTFMSIIFFFFNDTATTEIYTLSLHDALPISSGSGTRSSRRSTRSRARRRRRSSVRRGRDRSEEHTSELQSQSNLVCRLLLEKKKTTRRPCDTLTNRGCDGYGAAMSVSLNIHG